MKLNFYKTEHICILLFLNFLLYQILIFNIVNIQDFILNNKILKTNNLYYSGVYKKNYFYKQNCFLEDTLKQSQIFNNIFEKNIISKNIEEFYNYNNQSMFFIGLTILSCLIIILLFKSLLIKKNYFCKEHCFYINI